MRPIHVVLVLAGLHCGRGFVNRRPPRCLLYQRSERYWSKQAVIDTEKQAPELLDSTTHDEGALVDLSSPRLWLENQPNGVYTVMRSDLFVSFGERPWRLWGMPFHMERLKKSYAKLYGSNDSAMQHAYDESSAIVGSLLAETFAELRSFDRPEDTCVVMLTLLWYPADDSSVEVKGHVFTTGKMANPRETKMTPIKTALALPGPNQENPIPNRKDNFPDCKQSEWCTVRRHIEEIYLTDDVGEVLLTDNQGDVTTILEGLTSNFFAAYADGVLKTPKKGVLEGYARDRVKKAAKVLGYRIEEGPIALHEAALWKEAFLTSAIHICQPVNSIVMERDGKSVFQWKEDPVETGTDLPVWQTIYNQILTEENL